MSDLISGEFEGRAVKTEFGANSKTSKPEVRVEMEVVGGPHAGKRFPYNGKLDDKSIKWTKMRMMAIGWAGNDVRTFSDDVAAKQLVVPFSVRIAEYAKPDGTISRWSSVDRIGGNATAPLKPLAAKEVDEMNAWFQAADAEDTPF